MTRVIRFMRENVAIVGLFIILTLGSFINPRFFTVENISNVFRQASITGIVAVGMLYVIISSSIDLSVGSIMVFSGFLMLYLAKYSVILALAAALLSGAFFGCITGFLITKMYMPPFVGSLSMMMFIRGLSMICMNDTTFVIKNIPPFIDAIGNGSLLTYLSMPFIIFLCVVLLSAYFLRKRQIGRDMYIVGGNGEAAAMMGVNIVKTKIIAHIICGIAASLAGIILTSRMRVAHPLQGESYEMLAIASCVIGGAYLSGGIGTPLGTFFGSMIMGFLTNLFNLQPWLNSFWERVFIGGILTVVIVTQAIVKNGGRGIRSIEKGRPGQRK